MRYGVNLISTNDETIKRSGFINISLNKHRLKLELCKKKIPYERIQNVTVDKIVEKKQLSSTKALIGAAIAGPAGAIVGAVAGGKSTEHTITFEYLNDSNELKEVVFRTRLAPGLKLYFERKSGRTA